MAKRNWLKVVTVLVLAVLAIWIMVEKKEIDSRLARERMRKNTAEREQAGLDIARLARKANATTNWDTLGQIKSSMETRTVREMLTRHPAVVLLGRVDSIVSANSGEKFFITLTDVDDRLLVKLTCDAEQIKRFRNQAGVDRLYALYAVVAHVEDVRKVTSMGPNGSAGALYDFVVEAVCLDELPLHFTDITRLSDVKIPQAGT